MSNFSNNANDHGDEEEYEDDIGELEGNLDTIPESQPDFTREPGKKTHRGFNPESVQNASQIPNARFVTTQRGPVININNETFEVTQFRPEIIDQIRRRQQEEPHRPINPDYHGDVEHPRYQQNPTYRPTREEYRDERDYRRDPRDDYQDNNYPRDNDYRQEHNPRDQNYRQDQDTRQLPARTRASTLEQQREGKGKMIDLTDKDLSLVDDGSSYPRIKAKTQNISIFSPLLTGWNKSGLIFVLILLFMNPYAQDLVFHKIPHIQNVHIMLLFKCILIVAIWHIINGYILV
jgi:hypothetical protein